ncbi:hypothetical protein JCM5353_006947 [Sporobolomyces roseus]
MPSTLTEIPTQGIDSIRIIYDFISPSEQTHLIRHIDQVGGTVTQQEGFDFTPKKYGKNWGWKELNGRRSMVWGGTILANSNALVPTPFPKFMHGEWPDLLKRIGETGVYDNWTCQDEAVDQEWKNEMSGLERGPNHCLVNEYLPSQGILPHTDGPAYLPCTTTISLSSHTILSLRRPPSQSPSPSSSEEVQKLDIFLPSRSLLVLSGELYREWLHGIQPLSVSTIESLKRCQNWEGWWEWVESEESVKSEITRGELGFVEVEEGMEKLSVIDEEGEVSEKEERGETVEEKRKAIREMRKMLESSEGWRRDKRISLTCRRAAGKVRDLSGLLGKMKGRK